MIYSYNGGLYNNENIQTTVTKTDGGNGHEGSLWGDEKVMKLDRGDSCITPRMYLVPLNIHFKMDKIVKFMLYIFCYNKIFFKK